MESVQLQILKMIRLILLKNITFQSSKISIREIEFTIKLNRKIID